MTPLAANMKRTFRMPNCDGRVCFYAAAFGARQGERARERSLSETSENCPVDDRPLSYIFNYVGQYDESFRLFLFFPFFSIFVFFPVRAFYLLSLLLDLARRRRRQEEDIAVASYASSVGVHNLAARRSRPAELTIRSFADERSKFIPAGIKFRGVTNSVALSGRR